MKTSRGNVLFLILIAVALFGALAYAITQSGRGSGNANKEKDIIRMSQIYQFVAEMEAGINKMQLFGTPIDEIDYGESAFFGTLLETCTSGEECLFAPEGGGVSQPPPFVFNAGSGGGPYIFGFDLTPPDMNYINVNGVGTAAAEQAAISIILAGLNDPEAACERHNTQYGVSSITTSTNYETLTNAESGKYSGCMLNTANSYYFIYYVFVAG